MAVEAMPVQVVRGARAAGSAGVVVGGRGVLGEQLQLMLVEGLATGERLVTIVREGWIDQIGLARIGAPVGLSFLEDAEAQGSAAAARFELRGRRLQACPSRAARPASWWRLPSRARGPVYSRAGALGGDVTFVVVAHATLERLLGQLGQTKRATRLLTSSQAVAADEQTRPLEQLLGGSSSRASGWPSCVPERNSCCASRSRRRPSWMPVTGARAAAAPSQWSITIARLEQG